MQGQIFGKSPENGCHFDGKSPKNRWYFDGKNPEIV
jgi:hypothetical protein